MADVACTIAASSCLTLGSLRFRKAFEFVYRMEPADDQESRRPLFQSWVGKLRELPESAKVSSVRFPEVSPAEALS